MERLDDTKTIEVAQDIWWVGFADTEAGFSNNPYILIDKDEAVLFDPGPGHPIFRDMILQKISDVINPEKIRYIVASHPDPDICGLIPLLENLVHPDVVIIAHPRTSLFIPYYGSRKNILPVGDGDILELKSGRRISFYHTPYLHFAGNAISYDEQTGSLFTSDIFAVFSRDWKLYADESYIELAKNFINYYVDAKEAVIYAYEKIKNLDVKKILPQHGGIIDKNIDKFINMLLETEPGQLLKELKKKPSIEQEKMLLEHGIKWLQLWTNKDINVDTLDELLQIALKEGPSTVTLLIENITNRAKKMDVTNPLIGSKIHKWDNIQSTQSIQFFESIRKKYLKKQYELMSDSKSNNLDTVFEKGLLSSKVNVAIMFIDIRGFTDWSSDKSASEIVKTLNTQHELVSKLINSGGGRVNKILGDGILAYFPQNKLPECIGVAKRIHDIINESNLLEVGIGCDFGEVILGDIGEHSRLDYTLIGKTVNFASRMCDSAGKGDIAITNRVFENLEDDVKDEIMQLKDIQEIKVKIKPKDPEISGYKFSFKNEL